MTIYWKVVNGMTGKVVYANFLCAEGAIILNLRKQHAKENADGRNFFTTVEIDRNEFKKLRSQGK